MCARVRVCARVVSFRESALAHHVVQVPSSGHQEALLPTETLLGPHFDAVADSTRCCPRAFSTLGTPKTETFYSNTGESPAANTAAARDGDPSARDELMSHLEHFHVVFFLSVALPA